MAIISAAICDKQGKILIARQFEQITKHNLEENIHAFPKMISSTQQHTFVENEYVRYVYMPLDNLYLVLITSKNSNIIEHQETIRFLYKIIQEMCPSGINEANVQDNAFDIVMAIDDVISFGYRESISMAQVQNALEMESSEEKLHMMLMQARINEAKENAKKHQKEMAKKQKEVGSGSHMMGMESGFQKFTSEDDVLDYSKKSVLEEVTSYNKEKDPPSKPTTIAPKKGMQLGKKKPTASAAKPSVRDTVSQSKAAQKKTPSQNELLEAEEDQKPKVFDPLKEPVEVELQESLSATITRDGTFKGNLSIIGKLLLTVLDPARLKAQVALQCNPSEKMQNVKLTLHTNLNKQLWNKNKILSMKNPEEQSFPENQKVTTLKYKYTSTDNSEIPFTFNFWFDNTAIFEIEFNTEQTHFEKLENIQVKIPFQGNTSALSIKEAENSDFSILPDEGIMWSIPKIEDGDLCSAKIEIEFSEEVEEESFFPLSFNFEHPKTFLDISVRGAREVSKSENIKFLFKKSINAEELYVE